MQFIKIGKRRRALMEEKSRALIESTKTNEHSKPKV